MTILKIFVKVMEAGIVLSLITTVVFSYYKTEQLNKKRLWVAAGLVTGTVLGIVSYIIRSIPNFINRANLDFYSAIAVTISLVVLFVAMVLFQKTRMSLQKKYKESAEATAYGDNFYFFSAADQKKLLRAENWMSLAVFLYTVTTFFLYLPTVATTANALVYYGESISTVVLYRIAGYVLGLFVLVVAGFSVYATCTKLKDDHLFRSTLGAVLIIGITQVNVVVQRLYSLRIIPKNRMVFKTIAFIANNFNYFCFAMMVVLAIIPILLISRNIKITESYKNRAEKRKIRYLMRRVRRISTFFIIILVFNALSITALKEYAYREIPLSAPEDYVVEGNMIVLPLEEFEDEKLHRYEYKSKGGMDVRSIVIKKAQNSYGVCLDACEICGPSGYFMRGDDVVCKLCDVVMNKGTIGFAGGCNPIPIPFLVHDGKIKVDMKDLDDNEHIFK